MFRAYFDRMTSGPFQDLGISSAMAPYLGAIHHSPGVSMKELSEMLMVDKAHTTRTINKMIELGLVSNTAEGRRYNLILTDKGEDYAEKVKGSFDEAWRYLFKDLTEEERAVLRQVLEKVSAVMRDVTA